MSNKNGAPLAHAQKSKRSPLSPGLRPRGSLSQLAPPLKHPASCKRKDISSPFGRGATRTPAPLAPLGPLLLSPGGRQTAHGVRRMTAIIAEHLAQLRAVEKAGDLFRQLALTRDSASPFTSSRSANPHDRKSLCRQKCVFAT